ncbi:MAG: COX15/CtaA family protein [Candidatus Eremiobacteraeota bacterium]|nr:COX15/CtaA family protein [Candidatus Eremiobacteraeota bacterium]
MATLRLLSVAAMLDAFGTILLGSWTRINGAGMTCPQWPACPLDSVTLWEWTHRLFAVLLVPLVIATVAMAWKHRKAAPACMPLAGTIVALFIVQVLLGAATVHLANSPMSVVLHWGTGMAFIAALTAMALIADAAPRLSFTTITGALAGTAFLAFVTMCVGAYVSSSGAGLACISIPGCAGNVVVYTPGQFVQMLHRFVAAATLIVATGTVALAWMRAASLRVRAVATAGLGLVFVQVLLGLLNVVMRLPMDLREAHAANAALVFLAFVVAAILAALDAQALVPSAQDAR